MQNNSVLLWTTAYADLLNGERTGGIGVQMMFWAQAFAKNGWKVYSLYLHKKPIAGEKNLCFFEKDMEMPAWRMFIYLFVSLRILLKVKPKVVLCRGGRNRNLFFIALWCRIFKIKLVQFLASDVDLKKDNTALPYKTLVNIKFFRLGVNLAKFIVVQNEVQQQLVKDQFANKQILVIPNIWGEVGSAEYSQVRTERNVILWVGNMRKLKRPQWFFDIAVQFPDEQFVMIGGNVDQSVYDECLMLAQKTKNVLFLGGLPFFEANAWFSKAKMLLCTSEYEGFPNIFLQAWSNSIPVLSTVDPNNVITEQNLGIICNNIFEFQNSLRLLLQPEKYVEKQFAVSRYFSNAHSLQSNFEKLMKMLKL